MSDTRIEDMDFKQLRNEVQLLRDELAVFKRKYEDAIYNLDSDNFGKSFKIEQNNLKAQVKVAADAISAMVSDTDLQLELEKYSTLAMTASEISAAVVSVNNATDLKLSNYASIDLMSDRIGLAVKEVSDATDGKLSSYSTIDMTDQSIRNTVTASYINTKIGDTYVDKATLESQLAITENGIFASVTENYNDLDRRISSISVSADGISTRVSDLESFNTSTFIQTTDGFTLDGTRTTFTGVIYLTDNDKVRQFGIFHDESQYGMDQVFLHSATDKVIPLVLGDEDGAVYIHQAVSGFEVATRKWVKDNAGGSGGGTVVAIFG